jgi:hypothetical protein
MVMKMKYHSNGTEDKMKARLAAGGHRQIQSDGTDNASPTVDMTSFFTILAKASFEKSHMMTLDVKGAFLKSTLPNKNQYMRLSREYASALVESDGKFKDYLNRDGTVLVRLVKALYGLKEAAQLWYINIRNSLVEFGFEQSIHDKCVFMWKRYVGKPVLCTLHVDDMFITANDKKDLDLISNYLKGKYEEITIKKGSKLEYLGMSIESDPISGRIAVSQLGYIDDLINKYGVIGTSKTPSTLDLFKLDSNPLDLVLVDSTLYLSKVMSLMYLSKRSRPDILKEVVFCSTKAVKPTVGDMKRVERIFKYLNGTKFKRLEFAVTDLRVCASVDASHLCHPDAKGHGGAIISLGKHGGTIYAKSFKLKHVCLSSCEAELVAGHEGIQRGLFVRNLLVEFGYDVGPLELFQDNKSTIDLLNNDMSNSFKTKHINVRYFYAKELKDKGELKITQLPTEEMIADLLTKPKDGTSFKILVDWVLNVW